MCGICGKYEFESDKPVSKSLLEEMTGTMKHRGPDDEGFYVNGPIGLGHRRLSIIDLKTGHQPISNEKENCWLIFNGEMYNFKEHRGELKKKGHRFKTRTDAEVVLHLYEEYGTGCLEHIRGMFAFAIWDAAKKRLFLARDRLGQKPLYYRANNKRIIFGSEIKAIMADAEIPRKVDPHSLSHFLTFQYVPSPRTMFEGIKKLPPAHYLICENGDVKIERYWSLSYSNTLNIDETEAIERFRELFEEAVSLRLISDVPLGVFLSGGVDSSVVASTMARLSDQPIKTFSVGFSNSRFNELPYAAKLARRLGAEHHSFVVKPDCLDILPKLIRHYNEPFADPSAIPTYYVSKMAKTKVTVALNGDAGDEAFAGYDRYITNKIASYYDRLPEGLRNFIMNRASRFSDLPEKNSYPEKIKRYIKTLSSPPVERYVRWMASYTEEMKQTLFSNNFKKSVGGTDSVALMKTWSDGTSSPDEVAWALYLDTMTYLPDDLLVKVDVASMANSLECRSPFLDHKVLEFVAALPSDFKLRGFKRKYLLKEAFRYELDDELLNRKKSGFSVPISEWFKGELKSYIKEVLLDSKAKKRGFFSKDAVEKLITQHQEGKFDHGFRLWCLLNFELWHREFID